MVDEHSFEKHMEKQMGCMAGFLQIFDRHQILSGKRHYSAKRLPPSPVVDATSDSEKFAPASPACSKEFRTPKPPPTSLRTPSPDRSGYSPSMELRSPLAADLPPKSPLQLPALVIKEGARCSWKLTKETPRLSLDSRATTDAKGSLHPKEIRTEASVRVAANRCESIASDESQNHRSSSVIARLMGLEPLPDSFCSDAETTPELRRSASESRVSRDLFRSRFISEKSNFSSHHGTETANDDSSRFADPINYLLKNGNKVDSPKAFNRDSFTSSLPWNAPRHRKSFFDSGDFFPEPKQTVSICNEIENKLKLRGIEEPSKDLETLKQILEALQLKGLLHSRKQPEQIQQRYRNFVNDDLPVVLMKPSKLPNSTSLSRRAGNDYSGGNHSRGIRSNYAGENSPLRSPRRDRSTQSPTWTGRNPSRSPSPSTSKQTEGKDAVGRRSNSLAKPKPLTVETQKRTKESVENRRASPVHSPKLNPMRTGRDPTAENRSPRNGKSTAKMHLEVKKTTAVAPAEDETSSTSSSSITTSTDSERSKSEEYKGGRNLLERCDKLLHSIAEMNATDMQPSPVSVLDSSFYKDESSTPSPVTTRRNFDFKDESVELDDEVWSPEPEVSTMESKCKPDDDLVYISDILRASRYLPEESDVFALLEKQQYLEGKDICKVSRLQRKLIFDGVHEILDRNRRLPPWKAAQPSLDKVWSEFQRMQEQDSGEDLFDTICGVLKKDLAGDGITGWGDCPVEMSEMILDIERLIFKDLIGESIRDLAALEPRNSSTCMMPRRKLVF